MYSSELRLLYERRRRMSGEGGRTISNLFVAACLSRFFSCLPLEDLEKQPGLISLSREVLGIFVREESKYRLERKRESIDQIRSGIHSFLRALPLLCYSAPFCEPLPSAEFLRDVRIDPPVSWLLFVDYLHLLLFTHPDQFQDDH